MTTLVGLHDREAVTFAQEGDWILDTMALSGGVPASITDGRFNWITRVNWGYGSTGTIPLESNDNIFLERLGKYVSQSPICHRWTVGNEPNLPREWPDNKPIHPNRYGTFIQKCRKVIRSISGHENDQVLIAASGPWNDEYKYNDNPNGDWIKYFQDQIFYARGGFDGFTIHAYTHGYDPNLVRSEAMMNAPFQNRHYEFRTYRDYANAIPAAYAKLPIYLTESNGNGPWQATGLMDAMAGEINAWNNGVQERKIFSLIFYRWPDYDQGIDYSIQGKSAVEDEYRNIPDYQSPEVATTPAPQPTPTPGPTPMSDEGDGNLTPLRQGVIAAQAGLNVRDRPGTAGAVITKYPLGQVLDIYEEKTAPDGSTWYRVGEGAWVIAKYVDDLATSVDTFDCWTRSMKFIKKWEGGWADDPNDPGGATHYGITIGTFQRWREAQGKPKPTKSDLMDISQQEVEQIYKKWYWEASGADKLQYPMCMAVFNIAVNGGVERAKQFLAETGPRFVPYMARCIEWYSKIQGFDHFGRAWMRRCADLMREADK